MEHDVAVLEEVVPDVDWGWIWVFGEGPVRGDFTCVVVGKIRELWSEGYVDFGQGLWLYGEMA